MAYEVINYGWPFNRHVFETFDEIVTHHWYSFYSGTARNFRVRDLYDHQIVDIERVYELFSYRRRKYDEKWRKERFGKDKFRNGPVTQGAKRKRRKNWGYHNPTTQQERREEEFLSYDEDLEHIKFKRRPRRGDLPTLWDEIYRYDKKDRNWKRYRRTQYKIQE